MYVCGCVWCVGGEGGGACVCVWQQSNALCRSSGVSARSTRLELNLGQMTDTQTKTGRKVRRSAGGKRPTIRMLFLAFRIACWSWVECPDHMRLSSCLKASVVCLKARNVQLE